MFEHNFLDFPEIDAKFINGKRHYHVDDQWYPSVTTVLSGEEKPALEAWKKRVGEVEAKKITTAAANRGTGMHNMLEAYVLNQPLPEKAMPTDHIYFKMIQPFLDKYVGTVYGIEAPMYSRALGIAGRADFIANWNGRPAIIDFKSSTRKKKYEYLHGYFMQESLYSFMTYEMHDLHVPDLVTLIATEATGECDVYVEKASKWLPPALDLINKFYIKTAQGG